MKNLTGTLLALTVVLNLVLGVYCGGVAVQGSGRPGAWYRFHGKRSPHRKSPTATLFDVFFSKREAERENTMRWLQEEAMRREQNHHQRELEAEPEIPFWRKEQEVTPSLTKKNTRHVKRENLDRALAEIMLDILDYEQKSSYL